LGGKVTCTLGEVKNRCDFMIYWGGNPAECHPRHFTKYSLTQKGKFIPNGRKDRTMVLVDIRETPSAKAADLFLQIRPGKDFEVITSLRAIAKGQPVNRDAVAETGLTVEQLEDLAKQMKAARFGIIFFGMGLSMTRGKHMNSAAVLQLAAEMNAFTKFVAMPMRGHGNVTGSDMVLRWTTGYPFGVHLGRGYPRFNPGEFSTVDLLVRGDVDAALILGADPGATMPQPGIDHLAKIPTIVLDPKVTHTSRLSRVHITTAATGVSAPGTVYRMDEVPLPLRPALNSPYPTDEEVVRRIRTAVAKRPAWRPRDGGNGCCATELARSKI
jgi:formylmethanofuran dehydrogenase subunit B